jgi:hypothetical protein
MTFLTIGRAQTAAKGGIAVFPNPATEYISVQDAGESIDHISVFNLVGKKVKEFEYVRGENYSVADLPKGMYLVQLLDRNKRIVKTQKVDKR